MTVPWTDVLRPSDLGPAVFEVLPGHRREMRRWAIAQQVPTASTRELHAPAVDAWAVLDGGVTSVRGYGLTTLPSGVRVVGFQAFRLVVADLGLAGPDTEFPGETPAVLDELYRRHHGAAACNASAVEQAELLSACHDAVLLRWVAVTLRGGTAQGGGTAGPGAQTGTEAAARRSAR
jgi:hypothetical protein